MTTRNINNTKYEWEDFWMIRWPLKIKIIEVFGSQIKGAHAFDMGESRLSYIIQGHVEPRPEEKEIFRRELGYDFDAPDSPKAA